MRIRSATAADAPALAEVHVTSRRSGYRGLVPDHVLDVLSVEEKTRQWQGRLEAVRLHRSLT